MLQAAQASFRPDDLPMQYMFMWFVQAAIPERQKNLHQKGLKTYYENERNLVMGNFYLMEVLNYGQQ